MFDGNKPPPPKKKKKCQEQNEPLICLNLI